MKSRKWKKNQCPAVSGDCPAVSADADLYAGGFDSLVPGYFGYLYFSVGYGGEKLIPAGNGRWPGTPIDTG